MGFCTSNVHKSTIVRQLSFADGFRCPEDMEFQAENPLSRVQAENNLF